MSETIELIASVKTPAVINGNFEQVKAHFETELKKYDIVVTADTLADAKKLATELNKAAGEVKKRGKAVTDEAAAPIDAVKQQVKELAEMLLAGRQKLTDQIAKFEDETRAKAKKVLIDYLVEQAAVKGIQQEFQRASIDDLVNLSTLTNTGNLTSKVKAEVDARINADLLLQQQTETRLLKLELESRKAELSAALNRGHVEHFLFADEETYQEKLAALFETELAREQQAQEVMRKRIEQGKERQAEAEQRAAKAEADRKEAERIATEQKAKHDEEMAALKLQQEQQLAAQREEMQRQPVNPAPAIAPISMSAAAEKHAIGCLSRQHGFIKEVCTLEEAHALAASVQAETVGIWNGAGLQAVVLKGEAMANFVGGAA